MPRLTETRAQRAPLPKTKKYSWEYCSEIVGFRARIMDTGHRAWVVVAWFEGKEVLITLGTVGVLPFETPTGTGARELAITAITAARRGEDPRIAVGRAKRPQGVLIGELWEAYAKAGYPLLNATTGSKRSSSIKADTYRWRHFASIANEPAASFDNTRTQRWLDTLAVQRGHCLIMLKGLLSFGASRGLNDPHRISLSASPSRKIQNFLKPDELRRLDAALIDLAAEQPDRMLGFNALRLLLHTGMRKGEVLSLTWTMIDLDERTIVLERDKASLEGRSVLISDTAVSILRSLPKLARASWVFIGRRRDGHLVDLEFFWEQALKRAGLRRVRIHDLRHSFAASSIASGVSLYTTGKLLGHRSSKTTERYAHLSPQAQREALNKVHGLLASAVLSA